MALLTQDIGLLVWFTIIVSLLVLLAPVIIFIFVVKYIRNKDKRDRKNKFEL